MAQVATREPVVATSVQLTMVVSFDLGGSFSSSREVIERLKPSGRFSDAHTAWKLRDRVQPSYRYSNEPTILACEEQVALRLDSWQGPADYRLMLHPSGLVRFEITMALDRDGIAKCTQIEEDFYRANAVRYQPYLMDEYGQQDGSQPDDAADHDDRGVDLISPVTELRELLADLVRPRPQGILYPPTDMRTVVAAIVENLDEDGEQLVREFVGARRSRAQLWEAKTVRRELEGRELEVQLPKVTVRRWGCVLFASCDVDGALLVVDREEEWALPMAAECVAMAQSLWFIARTWVGVLDRIGTVEIRDHDMGERELRELQQKVIDLSAAEFEIQSAMATVEAAGVMLRDTWHVQLVGVALDGFEVAHQRRLIDQRLDAVARNHATVAEVLDRAHQNAARAQADRLQYLFSVAVAGGISSLVLSILDLEDAGWRVIVGVGTLVLVWALLAAAIWRVGHLRIRLTTTAARPSQR